MLSGSQVTLAPLTQADVPLLFTWINDREQVLHNAPYKPVSERQHQDWFDGLSRRTDLAMFGIRLRDGNRLIGSCQLHNISSVHRSAELQIRLGDVAVRGKGHGTEAVQLLLNHAFRDLNLHRVYLHVFAGNEAALRVYEKVGFVKEGVLRRAAHIDGQYVDVVVMGILADEWRPDVTPSRGKTARASARR